MKKRKVLYISGTRADYGLMRSTLFAIDNHKNLKLDIAVCGMHLMDEFGRTVDEIKKDGFSIWKIPAIYEEDNKESMAKFIGDLIPLLTKRIKKIKADFIMLLGDRAEMLAGAIVGAYLMIPVVHIHGGDVSSTVDEITRHAITKLSHIHFTATKKAAERIIKMGEDPKNVYVVGAPGLDTVLKGEMKTRNEIEREYCLNFAEPVLLVVQHPVTTEIDHAVEQIKQIMEAIKELGYQTIVIYPNADAGGRRMIKIIEEYRNYPFIQIYKSVSRKDYLSLMKYVDVLIGNSSSGIIEATSFHLPVVNIGIRQEGRERAGNIIDVDYKKEQIIKAIKKTIGDKNFKNKLKKYKNPYGDGKTGIRIAKILSGIKITQGLLQKRLTY